MKDIQRESYKKTECKSHSSGGLEKNSILRT